MKKGSILILLIFLSVTYFPQKQDSFPVYLEGIKVKDLSLDEGKIWIATEGNGIYLFYPKENRFRNFSTKNGKVSNDLFYAIKSGKKYVLAGSIDGLFIYDKRRRRWIKRKFGQGGQLSNYIRTIELDKTNNIFWIGRFQYLTKFDIRKRRFKDIDLTIRGENKTNSVTSLKIDYENNLLWVGTEAGLFRIDLSGDFTSPENRVFFNKRLNYFPGAGDKISVSSLLFERNYVWIGCDEYYSKENPNYNNGGLYRYDNAIEWIRYDKNNGLPANGISALTRIGNYIFVGVYQFGLNSKKEFGRGIAVINRVTGKVFQIADESLSEKINAMLFDGKNLWVATDNGLVKVTITNKLLNWR